MKVNSISEAWKEVNKLFPYDYMKDEESSECAGYPIYRATAAEHQNNWISDLGTSLEINTEDGKSQRIWIEANIYSDEFNEYITDLAIFAEGYVDEIKNHLVEIAVRTFEDKTVVKMLHEHTIRVEKRKESLKMDMLSMIRHPENNFTLGGYSLHDPQPFKTVLASILIDEWWHNQQKDRA